MDYGTPEQQFSFGFRFGLGLIVAQLVFLALVVVPFLMLGGCAVLANL